MKRIKIATITVLLAVLTAIAVDASAQVINRIRQNPIIRQSLETTSPHEASVVRPASTSPDIIHDIASNRQVIDMLLSVDTRMLACAVYYNAAVSAFNKGDAESEKEIPVVLGETGRGRAQCRYINEADADLMAKALSACVIDRDHPDNFGSCPNPFNGNQDGGGFVVRWYGGTYPRYFMGDAFPDQTRDVLCFVVGVEADASSLANQCMNEAFNN